MEQVALHCLNLLLLFVGSFCVVGLQSRCTGDDFNQLAGDDGLTSSVECQRKFANHLFGVLAGVVHGSHTRRLLGACAFLHSVVDHRRQ